MPKKVSVKKEEKKIEVSYSDAWIYILLLTTSLLLTQAIKNYTFEVGYINLTYSLFLLPIVYFIINLITKKYGYREAIKGISISGISLVLFVVVIDLLSGNGFGFDNVYKEFCGYVVSSFVNLTIYYFLLSNTSMPSLLVFLNFIFALIVNYFIYLLLGFNTLSLENFWISYFSTLLIQATICAIISFIDRYIKRGV